MTDQARDDRPMVRAPTPCGRIAPGVFVGGGGGLCRDGTGDAAGRGGLLSARSAAASDREADSGSPMAPKPPQFPAKAKACIVLFMYGGVSQVDTFDPKPALTRHDGKPIPTRDQRRGLEDAKSGDASGLVAEIRPARPGGDVPFPTCIPHLAGCVDDVAVIREHVRRQLRARLGPLADEYGISAPGVSESGLVGDLWAGDGQPELARLCGPARSSGRADLGAAQLGFRVHAGDLSGNSVSDQRRADLEPAAAAWDLDRSAAQPARPAGHAEPAAWRCQPGGQRAVGPHRQL